MIAKPDITRAVLLAAGRGSRLQPFTDKTPKPLLVHRGKPTLDYLLESLLAAGVTEVVLVAHYLSEQIEKYAQAWSVRRRQTIHVVQQSHLFGTANALQEVIEQLPEFVAAPFVLSATDYLVPREFFPDLLDFHGAHAAELSVSMKQLSAADMAERSSIRFLEGESIVEIVEKPTTGSAPSDIGANLTFVLPPSIAAYVDDVPISPRGERDIQQAINAWIRQGGKARGLLQPAPREWQATQ